MAQRTGHEKTQRPHKGGAKKKHEHADEKTEQKQPAEQKHHVSHVSRKKQANGPRGGREAVTARILDAAERLFAARGVARTSMRDVAAAAGVSHALAHRYVGSKSDLLAAVFSRRELALVEAVASARDLGEGVAAVLKLQGTARHMRMVARSAAEGVPYQASFRGFPATQKLLELAEHQAACGSEGDEAGLGDCLDARLVVAGIVSLAVGWATLDPWLMRAVRLDSWSEQELDEAVRALCLRIAEWPMAVGPADQAGIAAVRSAATDDTEA
jgi:AcrR family transcriptional regulator